MMEISDDDFMAIEPTLQAPHTLELVLEATPALATRWIEESEKE